MAVQPQADDGFPIIRLVGQVSGTLAWDFALRVEAHFDSRPFMIKYLYLLWVRRRAGPVPVFDSNNSPILLPTARRPF